MCWSRRRRAPHVSRGARASPPRRARSTSKRCVPGIDSHPRRRPAHVSGWGTGGSTAARHADPGAVYPIRIRAHAFGDGARATRPVPVAGPRGIPRRRAGPCQAPGGRRRDRARGRSPKLSISTSNFPIMVILAEDWKWKFLPQYRGRQTVWTRRPGDGAVSGARAPPAGRQCVGDKRPRAVGGDRAKIGGITSARAPFKPASRNSPWPGSPDKGASRSSAGLVRRTAHSGHSA